MKRIFLLALILGAGCVGLNAQTSWSATSLDGNTYRNGNVGIGIESPSKSLHIYKNTNEWVSAMVQSSFTNGINGAEYKLKTDADEYSIMVGSSGSLTTRRLFAIYHNTSSSNRFVINQDGYIGLGTSTPTERLEIKGNFKAIGNEYIGYFKSENDGWSEITIENQSGANNSPVKAHIKVEDGQVEIGSRTLHAVHIGAGDNNSHIVITTEGNIGIGTTIPTNKLEVAGTIRAEEIKVETGWADFVFENDYNLRPLQEVQTFIQQNGHLPEIPTAKKVEENGVSLGEMNVKLLQKIEELTLYTIEQQREIEELKEIISRNGLK